MQDVAQKAGVSISTVSYVLSGSRPISEETKRRILLAMDELGYKPNAAARALASKRSKILALSFPPSDRGLGASELEFVTSAVQAAGAKGYSLVLWTEATGDPALVERFTVQGLFDGMVLMEVHERDVRVPALVELGIPFTLIGRCGNAEGISYVDIDFDQTMSDAVSYLASLGHESLAFLNQSKAEYDAGYGPSIRCHSSFAAAVSRQGIDGVERFCGANPASGYEVFSALMEERPSLTALVAMNDRALPGVLRALADRSLAVPRDFSLMAVVSSARAAEMFMPPLTTLDLPSQALGKLATERLIDRLEGGDSEVHQALLPCILVERGSAGPRRERGRSGHGQA
jgi:DNA-binding LacI/PurR family transcriptional regulator